MEKDPKVFLRHIFESIEYIENYSNNISEEEFLKSPQLQDAIIRRIEIIGEAARNLPDNFKEKHSEIAWQKIVGMRNEVIHGYFGINIKLVWDTIKKSVPELKKQILPLL